MVVGGIVESVRIITTKKNEPMAFVRWDTTDSIEVVVFPKTMAQVKALLVLRNAWRYAECLLEMMNWIYAEAIKELTV